MSTHGPTPPTYVLSNAPPRTNPYQAMQDTLVSKMYPIVSAGYDVRIAIILAILAYTAVISLIYLVLTIRKTKAAGQKVWIARHIRQPQGLYLCFNQFLLYPISTIIMCIIWTAYVCKLRSIWYLRETPVTVYYWSAMIWIPFYLHLYTTTCGTLSAANLCSTRKSSSKHIIGPCLVNSFFVCYLPIIILIQLGVGIWSGKAWYTFGSLWQEQYDIMERSAATWSLGDVVNPAVQETLSHYVDIRSAFFVTFQKRQNILMILFALSSGILLLINIVGGFALLSVLRSVSKFHAKSSSTNPSLSDSFGSISKVTPPGSSDYPKAYVPTVSSTGSANGATNDLQRLESDITLFFFTVPPILLVAIGFYVWRALSLTNIIRSSQLTELACLGIIWIYSSFAGIIMTVLTLKFRTAKTKKIPKIKLTLNRDRPTHIVQLHDIHSDDARQEDYVASPARHSHTVLPKFPKDKGINFDVETARDVC